MYEKEASVMDSVQKCINYTGGHETRKYDFSFARLFREAAGRLEDLEPSRRLFREAAGRLKDL